MNISQEIQNAKTLFAQGSELLLLRMRLLRIDVEEQLAGTIKIFASIAIAAVLSLVGLIALLLGINVALPAPVKIWVFFGTAAVCLLIVVFLALRVPLIWKKNTQQISHTMQEMQDDLSRFTGKIRNQTLTEGEINE
ncbi:phage holin family protein [Neisseriaceae bacterium B1]